MDKTALARTASRANFHSTEAAGAGAPSGHRQLGGAAAAVCMVEVGDVDMSVSVRSDIGVTFVGDGAGGVSGDATADDDDRARCMLSRAASMRERTSRCSRIF